MSEWETESAARLAARRVIRKVIDDHCVLPVELLPEEDVAELRTLLRATYQGAHRGWEYVAWRAEVRLALGVSDPLAALKAKAPPKVQDGAGVMPGMKEWLERRRGEVKVKEPVAQVVENDLLVNAKPARAAV